MNLFGNCWVNYWVFIVYDWLKMLLMTLDPLVIAEIRKHRNQNANTKLQNIDVANLRVWNFENLELCVPTCLICLNSAVFLQLCDLES